MRFEQLNEGVWAMTYLIVDEATGEAALVDPVYDFMQQYVDLLEKDGLTLVYVIATHTHADHITACFTLQEQYDCEYVMSTETASLGVTMHVDDEETPHGVERLPAGAIRRTVTWRWFKEGQWPAGDGSLEATWSPAADHDGAAAPRRRKQGSAAKQRKRAHHTLEGYEGYTPSYAQGASDMRR